MTLIATVGASNANSYCDEAYANAYMGERIGSEKWTQATGTNREASLIMATGVLDTLFDWVGEIATTDQSLRWPRLSVTDVDGREISEGAVPPAVKQATCELALQILIDGGYSAEISDMESVKVGSIRLGYDVKASKFPVPRKILDYLSSWGEYKGPSGGRTAKTVNLIRV